LGIVDRPSTVEPTIAAKIKFDSRNKTTITMGAPMMETRSMAKPTQVSSLVSRIIEITDDAKSRRPPNIAAMIFKRGITQRPTAIAMQIHPA